VYYILDFKRFLKHWFHKVVQ